MNYLTVKDVEKMRLIDGGRVLIYSIDGNSVSNVGIKLSWATGSKVEYEIRSGKPINDGKTTRQRYNAIMKMTV